MGIVLHDEHSARPSGRSKEYSPSTPEDFINHMRVSFPALNQMEQRALWRTLYGGKWVQWDAVVTAITDKLHVALLPVDNAPIFLFSVAQRNKSILLTTPIGAGVKISLRFRRHYPGLLRCFFEEETLELLDINHKPLQHPLKGTLGR